MFKKNAQFVNTILIVAGAAMLIYTIASREPHKYLQIIGFITIMLGLYRATNYWVETKDDHKEQTEENDRGNEI